MLPAMSQGDQVMPRDAETRADVDARNDRLWAVSGALVVAGFTLRVIARLASMHELRVSAVAVLACGVVVAVAAAIGDRIGSTDPAG